VLLDASLVVSLRSAARQRGMTIAALVERALEVELDGYVDASAGGGGGAAAQGGVVGGDGGRVSERGPVSPDSGRRVAPDWDALLAAGKTTRMMVTAGAAVRDPLEEIA
jgi:hypothetical protein